MKKILILIFLSLITIGSCSRLDLAVNLANSYIINKTDDYFDLNKEQTKWLRSALEKDIERVKKTILAQVASELHGAADKISSTKKFDDLVVLSTYTRLENIAYQTGKLVSPTAVGLADKLTPKQIDHFKKEFHEKMEDLREKPEKKSYERMKKHFDSWMGMMSSNQKKELKKFIASNPPPISETIRHRENLANGFISSYNNREQRLKYVEKLFTQYEAMKDPAYLQITHEKAKKVAGFVAKILNIMTEDQRRTLVETLHDRANQLVKISRG